MTYLPKAERMFQKKLKAALAPVGYVHDLGGSWKVLGDEGEIAISHHKIDRFDFNYLSELFNMYGCYLLLIEDEHDVSVEADTEANFVTPDGVCERMDSTGALGDVQSEQANSVPKAGAVAGQEDTGSEEESEATSSS